MIAPISFRKSVGLKGVRHIALLLFFVAPICGFSAENQPSTAPAATPSITVSALAASAIPEASPSPSTGPLKLGTFQKWSLKKEYKKALAAELSALKHRQEVELSELKAAQRAHFNEFEEREKSERRQFFKGNKKGSDQRTYIQGMIERIKSQKKIIKEEYDRRKKEFSIHTDSLKSTHDQKIKEFEEILKTGERPPERFWPQPGR